MAAAFRLRTFGGLSLISANGVVQAPAQRKRLGLLALLAAAGARGVPRDRVVAFLWPESDEQRANAALHQLVYATKRELGPAIVSAGAELALDPSVLSSDAAEFLAADDAGDFAAAVAVYAGPFLDGVFLRGLPEFERWVEQQRARFAQRYVAALEILAARAEQRGDQAAAAATWRQVAAAEPLQSAPVLRLMRCLEQVGDTAAALQAARVHTALVQSELGAGVDAGVELLAGQMRDRAAAKVQPSQTARVAEDSHVAFAGDSHTTDVTRRHPARRASPRVWISAVAALALTAFLAARAHSSVHAEHGRWVDAGPTPVPIAQAAAGLVGSIDIFGGVGDHAGTMTPAAWSFDYAARKWSKLPPLPAMHDVPAPRAWRATNVAAIASRVYVAGGNYPGYCTANAKMYEPATRQWTELAPMPVALCHAAAVAVQGRVYVIGGTNTSGDAYNAAVFAYEPGINRWRTVEMPMPYAVTGAAAAVEGTTIYVIGGSISGGACLRKVMAFETLTERWAVRDSLSTPRCEAGAAQLNGRIYAVGGLNFDPRIFLCRSPACGTRYTTTLRSVESYDPETNTWRPEADLPVAAAGMVTLGVPGHIIVIGGYDHERFVTRAFEYDPR